MLTAYDTLAIGLAVLFGAAIGLEREISSKAAGLSTNVLICLGAAVFTVISKQMAAGTDASVTRIAAQVVTGVGFLGAGAIIVDRGGVYGLTTAATIWLVASIGVACGAHLYGLSFYWDWQSSKNPSSDTEKNTNDSHPTTTRIAETDKAESCCVPSPDTAKTTKKCIGKHLLPSAPPDTINV